jgi:hypothetical protein
MFRAQEKYKKTQKEKGLVMVSVYVPIDDRQRLTKYAEKLRKASRKTTKVGGV